ncbi:MAG: hypothetical protein WBE34_12310 [Candidatus Nitrosopolaris sp.]
MKNIQLRKPSNSLQFRMIALVPQTPIVLLFTLPSPVLSLSEYLQITHANTNTDHHSHLTTNTNTKTDQTVTITPITAALTLEESFVD